MRYLGNKSRMISNIEDFVIDMNIDGEIFCDLFTGSASVADKFKNKYKIIANDILETSCVFAKAKINNQFIPSFNNFKKVFKCDIFDYFSAKEYKYSKKHFLWNNYSPKGDRQFFTEKIANKIDGIRIEIENLKNDKVISENEYNFILASLLETVMGLSNTTGTYEAFLKKWDKRAFKEFKLMPLEMQNSKLVSKKNVVFNEDANALIRKITGDILYLDTPYTITDYNSAYHLLETIVKYDYPAISGITGRRANKPEKSKYSAKTKALEAYEDLIKNAKFKHIIISYSTQSLIPIDDMLEMLKKYSFETPIIKYYPFREYKNIRSSQKSAKLREVLIYIKNKNFGERACQC